MPRYLGPVNTNSTVWGKDDGAGPVPSLTLQGLSASPAASDFLGPINFAGQNSVAALMTYARAVAKILDPTSASEDSSLNFDTRVAGALATRGFFGQGLVVGSPTGGDIGAGKINAEDIRINNTQIPVITFDQYTSPGVTVWNKPSSGTFALIMVWSAGGGGARGGSTARGGGGGGGFMFRWIPLASLGATENVTVGAGGVGKTGSNGVGAAGGDSSFGTWVTVFGGAGGASTNSQWAGGGNAIAAPAVLSYINSERAPIFVDPSTLVPSVTTGTVTETSVGSSIFNGGAGGGFSSGGTSVWGGGGGAGATAIAGGTSRFAGAGGASSSTTGGVGSNPGGGGGGGGTSGGDGGRGEVWVLVF